jgi:hypothetical protein
MARLDQEKRREWKAALVSTKAHWIVCGLDINEENPCSTLEGMPGLIDWTLHGQVSDLLLRKKISEGECCLVPGDSALGRPNFLFFPRSSAAGAQALMEKARKLKIDELALAESTFPEDFLTKLKQTLKKEGIRFMKLEPEAK